MFFSSAKKSSKKEAANKALSVSKDEVKNKLADAANITKQLEATVTEAAKASSAVVKKIRRKAQETQQPIRQLFDVPNPS